MACPRHDRTGHPPLLGRLRRMTCTRLMAVLLLALTLRSLIPVGFEPASDGSLSLTLCPHGFPAGLLAEGKAGPMPGGISPGHQTHGHGAAEDSHCNFCTGFSAAPPSPVLTTLLLLLAGIVVAAFTAAPPDGIRPVRLPQARAPPAPF